MRPSGPLIPPYPTYAMPYAGQQQTETSKLSPPWGGGAWTPRGLLLTATVTVAKSPSEVKVIEHIPLAPRTPMPSLPP